MKNKIDWLNHLVGFIVVVIGILLAFQLNTCAIQNAQKETIETHLMQIQEESTFNLQSIKTSIALGESNLSKADTLLRLIYSDNNESQINQLALELLNVGGIYLRKNAYSSLVESGDIRFIRDFKTKQNIINLYEYYKWVEGIDQLAIETFNKDFYPYLATHLDLARGQVQEKSIYSTKVFMNGIATYRFMTAKKIEKYKDCLAQINTYITSNQ